MSSVQSISEISKSEIFDQSLEDSVVSSCVVGEANVSILKEGDELFEESCGKGWDVATARNHAMEKEPVVLSNLDLDNVDFVVGVGVIHGLSSERVSQPWASAKGTIFCFQVVTVIG